MKRLLVIPLLLLCLSASGQFTKPQLYTNINDNIRLKTYSPTRISAVLDSIVATMNTGGSGLADPMTTRGDIIFRNSSNVTARLGRGTANQVLTSDGTDLSWGSPSWASITGKPNLIELPYAPTSSEDGSSIIWNDTSGEWEYYAPTYYSFGNGISTSTLGDIGLQVDRLVGATTETINIAPGADNTHDFNIGYCCGGFLGSKRYGYIQLSAKDGINSRAGSDATTYTVNSTGEYGFIIQNYSTQGVTSMGLSNGASGKVFIMEVPRPTKSPTLIMDSIKSEFRNHRLTVKGVGLTSSKTLQLMNNNGTERFAFTDGGKFSVAITPANDDTLTQVLVRDGSSGEIKYRSASSLSGGSGITIGSTAITGGTAGRLLTSGTTVGEQTLGTGVSTLLSTPTKANFNSALSDGDFLFVGDVTQYTDEQAQDAVGAMVDASLTYVDGTPLLQRAALTGAISASAGSNSTSLGSFTKAQLDAAISDGNALYQGSNTITTNLSFIGDNTVLFDQSGTSSFRVKNDIYMEVDAPQLLMSRAASTITAAATTSASGGVIIPHGVAPSSPSNGQLWTTTSGFFARINGATSSFNGTNTGDQSLSHSSDATSHTATLSASGGSLKLIEGSNVTLTTSGNEVTIAATGGGGGGDVVGPASSVNNTLTLFDGTTGKLLKQAANSTLRLTSDGSDLVFHKVSSVTGNNLIKSANGTSDEGHAMGLYLLGGNAFAGSGFAGGNVIIEAGEPDGGGAPGSIYIGGTGDKLTFFEGTPVVKQSAVTTTQGIADALTAYGLLPSSTISGGGSGLTYAQVKAIKFK